MGLIKESHSPRPMSGFSLVEVITVLAVLAVLAALIHPVFASAKRAAQSSASIQNLRQLHLAFRLYQDEWEGGGEGLSALGLPPPDLLVPELKVLLYTKPLWTSPCGYHKDGAGRPPNGPGLVFPQFFMQSQWLKAYERRGEAVVYLADHHCNPSDAILNSPFVSFKVNVIRLSGQAFSLTAKGDIQDAIERS